ncbi:hypothetical protein lerEdw1_000011 [Lerista edwardsae]|nr:hypothetical protein lerEdw1_000011 [Lerista edwardsae]
MRRLSSCCRKPTTGFPDPDEDLDIEPRVDPEPKPDPEPIPEPLPKPQQWTQIHKTEIAPEPAKTEPKEPKEPKERKEPRPVSEISILCMQGTKRLDPADSSSDVRSSSIHFRSEKNDTETIINIMERAKKGEKSFLDNSDQKICFLRAVSASCKAARENGQDNLNLPYSKDELAEVIVLVMKTLPVHSVPPTMMYAASGQNVKTKADKDCQSVKAKADKDYQNVKTKADKDCQTSPTKPPKTDKCTSTDSREQIQ